jgi:trigger factor
MQVTETHHEILSRSFSVRVPAEELGALLEARIAEITPTLRLKGFRPGKVPTGHVRKMYGKSLMGEVIEKTFEETTRKVLEDNKLRIAAQPDLKPSSDMEEVIAGRQDLTYALEVEVMPEFDPADVTGLELTRLLYNPEDAEIDAALAEVAEANRVYEPRKGKAAKAQDGDQLLIDFIGSIDGQPFEGGAAEDAQIVLGAGRFIPGFEEQLAGAAAGSHATVDVTFPDDYQVERLKGKAARFEVDVKEVRAPKAAKADDALAVSLGLSDLDALRQAVRANIEGEYLQTTHFKLKRALLDQLDKTHDIPLPARMVEAEFEGIWRQLTAEKEAGEISPEDEGKSEETMRREYRKIAERRVRLGLVLAEIGRRAEISVADQEVIDALRAQARQYGDMAQRMFDMMRQNPQILANTRAPLYEEKVVDFILGKARVADRAVSREELLKEDELPEGFDEDEKPKATKPAKAKAAKASPAKAAAKPAKAERADPEPKPAAKAKPKPSAKPKPAK